MEIEEIQKAIREKYRYRFDAEIFASLEELRKTHGTNPNTYVEFCDPWEEFGVTLIEIGDNNHHSEIVIIKQ